jgi:hypothetical protein
MTLLNPCTCPPQWHELIGPDLCANEDCPAYTRCAGQTIDGPPCGGCDDCTMAYILCHDDGVVTQRLATYDLWVRGRVANA